MQGYMFEKQILKQFRKYNQKYKAHKNKLLPFVDRDLYDLIIESGMEIPKLTIINVSKMLANSDIVVIPHFFSFSFLINISFYFLPVQYYHKLICLYDYIIKIQTSFEYFASLNLIMSFNQFHPYSFNFCVYMMVTVLEKQCHYEFLHPPSPWKIS